MKKQTPEEKKDKTTITVERDVHKDIMLFKIQSDAKDVNEVLKLAMQKLKEHNSLIKGGNKK